MKHIAFTTLALLCLPLPTALAQGDLVPAGPPAPTMKTLQQIEPRGDVNRLTGDATAHFVISSPGSYFLSGDIIAADARDGIRIEANDVSLDLRGFRVSGASTGGIGILYGNGQSQQSSVKRCILRNGIVTGWKSHGVAAGNASQGLFRDIIASANGGIGLNVKGASVSGCVAGDNDGKGIAAEDSVVTECAASSESLTEPAIYGYQSQLSNLSVVNGTLTGTGIRVVRSSLESSMAAQCETCISGLYSQIRHCTASNYGIGIAVDRSQVTGNTCTFGGGGPASGFGIQAGTDCLILENMLETNRFPIDITGSYCRVERNHVSMKNFLSVGGIGIRCANGTPGENVITLNNITGRFPGIHLIEIQPDAGDHAPIAGFGAPADANYLQPAP